jgi:probable O-glycosylation ligase (exosortase A-associated)
MRDIAIMLMLPILLYTGFKRPFISVSLWLWSSAINLNQLVYGFASSITFAKLFAGLTILSFFLSKEKSVLKSSALTNFIVVFYVLATISCIFSIGNADLNWLKWGEFTKIVLFYFFAIAIMSKKIHFDFMIWILLISIGALASNEGAKFLVSGGSHRISSLRGIQGDNNFFGVMIVTIIPLVIYILIQTKHKLLKTGVMAVIFFMILGIFSTFSRGAFLGLSVCAIFFWSNSKRKILWAILLFTIVFSLNNLMPDEWMNRMNTVETADQDSSFMHRVISWKIGTLVAMDNFFGGGFNVNENASTWQKYSSEFYKLDFISTPPPPDIVGFKLATHSLYFQVLSNHGFIGLFVFLMMLLISYLKVSRVVSVAVKNNLQKWVVDLAKMLKLSLVSYAVSGAAVNVAYMDFLYAIFAMITVLDAKVVNGMLLELQQQKNQNRKRSILT